MFELKSLTLSSLNIKLTLPIIIENNYNVSFEDGFNNLIKITIKVTVN